MESRLQSLFLFKGRITLNSALHIGGGTINTMNTDSTVVRTPDGTPFIPGSSFKGVFRSTVEKLAGQIPSIEVCSLSGGKDCFHRKFMEKTVAIKPGPYELLKEQIGNLSKLTESPEKIENEQHRYELLKKQIENLSKTLVDLKRQNYYELLKEQIEIETEEKKGKKPEKYSLKTLAELKEETLYARVLKELCDTCQLFGNGFTASKIFFSDLKLIDWAGVTQIRDGVVIDRDSEKAVEGLKYDFEVIPAGAVFTFEIRLENPRKPDDLALTCLGLNEFQSGLGHLGGKRSRGLGNCILEVTEAYQVDFTDKNQLKNYLLKTQLHEKMKPIEDIPGFMTGQIEELIMNKMQ